MCSNLVVYATAKIFALLKAPFAAKRNTENQCGFLKFFMEDAVFEHVNR